MSTVLLFFLKPHCDSGSNDSVMLLSSLCSNTFARTLPATARSDIPLWLPQMVLSPLFLYMVTILASLHCCGMPNARTHTHTHRHAHTHTLTHAHTHKHTCTDTHTRTHTHTHTHTHALTHTHTHTHSHALTHTHTQTHTHTCTQSHTHT